MKNITFENIQKLSSFLVREDRTPLAFGVMDSVADYAYDMLSMKMANIAKNLISEELGIDRQEEDLPDIQILNGYAFFDGSLSEEGSTLMMMLEDSFGTPMGDKFLPKGPLWRSSVFPVSCEWKEFACSNGFDPNEESWGDCYIPYIGGDTPRSVEYCDDDNIFSVLCNKYGAEKGLSFEAKDVDKEDWQDVCLDYFRFPKWCRDDEEIRKTAGRAPAIEIEASEYGNAEDNEVFWLEHVGVEYFDIWRKGKKRFKKQEKELLDLYDKAMSYMMWECCLNENGVFGPQKGGQRFDLVREGNDHHPHFLIAGHHGMEFVNNWDGYNSPFYDTGLQRLSPQFIVASELIDSIIRWFDERYGFIPKELYLKEEEEKAV